MRLAIMSDLHSNPFALRAVLDEVDRWRAEAILCAGDVFGYYPWAQETFELLRGRGVRGVRGNHDQLVLDSLGAGPGAEARRRPAYYPAAAQNGRVLSAAARGWLAALPLGREEALAGWRIQVCHGTPADRLEGRYYPDDSGSPPWLPGQGEMLILGHTHHPVCRWTEGGGLLVNPGSVGQPRDGDPRPSWIALDTALTRCVHQGAALRRVAYDWGEPMAILRGMGWPVRFIRALEKVRPGPLDTADTIAPGTEPLAGGAGE